MKKVDIRKIYVGEILKQNEVYQRQSQETGDTIFFQDKSHVWDYEKKSQIGLFVRVLGGYKHILTDTIYPKPSKRTGNKYVINPNNIEELVKKERALASHLINKYQSYYIDTTVLEVLEEDLNSYTEYLEEEENEL